MANSLKMGWLTKAKERKKGGEWRCFWGILQSYAKIYSQKNQAIPVRS
jgi:hypothetical protein